MPENDNDNTDGSEEPRGSGSGSGSGSDEFEIERTELSEIYELAALAREDGVEVQPRDDACWYRVSDAAIACLWWPKNRVRAARLSHCWVREDFRGQGIGKALVERRVRDAKTAEAETIDTYTYHPGLYEDLGFTAEKSYPMGTTHMKLEVAGNNTNSNTDNNTNNNND